MDAFPKLRTTIMRIGFIGLGDISAIIETL